MKELYNNHKDMFEYTKAITAKMYYPYKNLYNRNNIEYHDLLQTAYIVTLKLLKKCQNEPKEKIKRVISKYLGLELNKIRTKLIKKKITIQLTGSTKDEDNIDPYENSLMLDEENNIIGEEIAYNENLNYKTNSLSLTPFIFEDLKKIMRNIEYQIIFKKFKEYKSLKDIGLELGYTEARIHQIYTKTLSKLKCKFKFYPNLVYKYI